MITSRGGFSLPLPRPEYPGGPEVFLSAVAWNCLEPKPNLQIDTHKEVGLAYKVDSEKPMKSVHIHRTYPQELDRWSAALASAGIASRSPDLGEAVAGSLTGVRPAKGFTIGASPVTRHTALLQNPVGLMRKENPFNVALMLEQMYALGAGTSPDSSLSASWLRAMSRREQRNSLLAAIDEAVSADRLANLVEGPLNWAEPKPAQHSWGSLLAIRSPFSWFKRSWDTLASDRWVDTLPPRVWVDWATTIMRMAVGFAYLWEAAWYEAMARIALTAAPEDTPRTDTILLSMGDVLPWRRASDPTSVRDVVGPMKGRIGRGAAIRDLVRSHVEAASPDDAVLELLGLVRDDAEFAEELRRAAAFGTTKNAWEAVRYALAARSDSGSEADYYGLLRNAGTRYSVVAPGTEWTALLVALTCEVPGGTCTVGDLRRNLADLGVRPATAELVALAEDAGLARGSADADEAVLVQSPY